MFANPVQPAVGASNTAGGLGLRVARVVDDRSRNYHARLAGMEHPRLRFGYATKTSRCSSPTLTKECAGASAAKGSPPRRTGRPTAGRCTYVRAEVDESERVQYLGAQPRLRRFAQADVERQRPAGRRLRGSRRSSHCLSSGSSLIVLDVASGKPADDVSVTTAGPGSGRSRSVARRTIGNLSAVGRWTWLLDLSDSEPRSRCCPIRPSATSPGRPTAAESPTTIDENEWNVWVMAAGWRRDPSVLTERLYVPIAHRRSPGAKHPGRVPGHPDSRHPCSDGQQSVLWLRWHSHAHTRRDADQQPPGIRTTSSYPEQSRIFEAVVPPHAGHSTACSRRTICHRIFVQAAVRSSERSSTCVSCVTPALSARPLATTVSSELGPKVDTDRLPSVAHAQIPHQAWSILNPTVKLPTRRRQMITINKSFFLKKKIHRSYVRRAPARDGRFPDASCPSSSWSPSTRLPRPHCSPGAREELDVPDRARVLDLAHGNPLALLELPRDPDVGEVHAEPARSRQAARARLPRARRHAPGADAPRARRRRRSEHERSWRPSVRRSRTSSSLSTCSSRQRRPVSSRSRQPHSPSDTRSSALRSFTAATQPSDAGPTLRSPPLSPTTIAAPGTSLLRRSAPTLVRPTLSNVSPTRRPADPGLRPRQPRTNGRHVCRNDRKTGYGG